MTIAEREIWFIYDGQCPLCMMGAAHFRIKQAAGILHLFDAREQPDHPIMQEINAHGINLDDGMVIKLDEMLYHGADALHVMALLGTNSDWFNRINTTMFKSKWLSALIYPSFRAARNAMLKIKGVGKINNLQLS